MYLVDDIDDDLALLVGQRVSLDDVVTNAMLQRDDHDNCVPVRVALSTQLD